MWEALLKSHGIWFTIPMRLPRICLVKVIVIAYVYKLWSELGYLLVNNNWFNTIHFNMHKFNLLIHLYHVIQSMNMKFLIQNVSMVADNATISRAHQMKIDFPRGWRKVLFAWLFTRCQVIFPVEVVGSGLTVLSGSLGMVRGVAALSDSCRRFG